MGQEAHMASYPQAAWVAIRGWGLLTGWGAGLQSLPTLPAVATQGQRLPPVATPEPRQRTPTPGDTGMPPGVVAVQAALDHGCLAPHGGGRPARRWCMPVLRPCGGQLDFGHE